MFQFRIKIKEIILCVRDRIISLSYLDSAKSELLTKTKETGFLTVSAGITRLFSKKTRFLTTRA